MNIDTSNMKIVPALNYDRYFIPVLDSKKLETLSLNKSNTKTEIKKITEIEKKKEKHNEMLFQYSKEYEIKSKSINQYRQEIELNKETYDKLLNEKKTYSGNLKEIQIQITAQLKELNENYKNPLLSFNQKRNDLVRLFNKEKMDFGSKSLVNHMDVEIDEHKIEKKRRDKEQAKDTEWKRFLKSLNNLPDEIHRIIRSYFTYETRAALLEKHHPIKLLQSLKKAKLMKVIYRIFTRKYKPELAQKLKDIWNNFYKNPRISKEVQSSASVKDMKILIEYLFIKLKENKEHRICYDLYSLALLY